MEDLISLLSDYAFVVSYQVLKFERTQTTRRLKISVEIIDGSRLLISESTNPRGFRYAYHWQDAQNLLLARWDNAPHHHDFPTFPDHFHDGSEIKSAVQPTLKEVLDFISMKLSK